MRIRTCVRIKERRIETMANFFRKALLVTLATVNFAWAQQMSCPLGAIEIRGSRALDRAQCLCSESLTCTSSILTQEQQAISCRNAPVERCELGDPAFAETFTRTCEDLISDARAQRRLELVTNYRLPFLAGLAVATYSAQAFLRDANQQLEELQTRFRNLSERAQAQGRSNQIFQDVISRLEQERGTLRALQPRIESANSGADIHGLADDVNRSLRRVRDSLSQAGRAGVNQTQVQVLDTAIAKATNRFGTLERQVLRLGSFQDLVSNIMAGNNSPRFQRSLAAYRAFSIATPTENERVSLFDIRAHEIFNETTHLPRPEFLERLSHEPNASALSRYMIGGTRSVTAAELQVIRQNPLFQQIEIMRDNWVFRPEVQNATQRRDLQIIRSELLRSLEASSREGGVSSGELAARQNLHRTLQEAADAAEADFRAASSGPVGARITLGRVARLSTRAAIGLVAGAVIGDVITPSETSTSDIRGVLQSLQSSDPEHFIGETQGFRKADLCRAMRANEARDPRTGLPPLLVRIHERYVVNGRFNGGVLQYIAPNHSAGTSPSPQGTPAH